MAENNTKKPASESLMPKGTKKQTPPKQAPKQPEQTAPAQTKKRDDAKPKTAAESRKKPERVIDENSILLNLAPYVLGFFALLILFLLIFPGGAVGTVIQYFKKLFSIGVWFVPFFMFIGAFKFKKDIIFQRVGQKAIFGVIGVIFISTLMALICNSKLENVGFDFLFGDVKSYMENGAIYKNGGLIGGIIGIALEKVLGTPAAIIVSCFVITFFILFEFGVTPADIIIYTRDKIREFFHDLGNKPHKTYEAKQPSNTVREEPKNAKAAQQMTEKANDGVKRNQYQHQHAAYRCNRDMAYHLTKKTIDIDIDDKKTKKSSVFDTIKENLSAGSSKDAEKPAELPKISDIPEMPDRLPDDNADTVGNEKKVIPPEKVSSQQTLTFDTEEKKAAVDPQLGEIFAEGAIIEAGGMSMDTSVLNSDIIVPSEEGMEIISETDEDEKENLGLEVENGKLVVESHPTIEELYEYPTLDFLKKNPDPATFTVTEELTDTAVKLVDTLSNFGVKTKITNICCGPTVTRYELQPEIGVRVKAIQNLSDDIALHLAAAGVRIEAPIPGKDAVGIEIPNKNVSTVYIRDLIENPQFRKLQSKIAVCLGMDVAGSPVYMNIEKMPHLLIAGTTGSGKSVCINSFIISILYKARPDEVKFILIDPKKVEFNPYKGIPHLLVPVVNDPKKAAGALSWAVSEMERRYELIGEVGARNIDGYNEATKNDPEKPPMSRIVIIIDELADLMMTAKEEVETSVCRLAQKARAAGIHLIIGTQRPSVDIVTGVIKANIPSRIAMTVVSQVDSRTMIDTAGAEKLIGNGDMLYAPIGSRKPTRVQGTFVTDSEVEAITEFLRDNFKAEYDSSIIEDIEREAEKCGEKKKGKNESGGEEGIDAADSLSGSDDMIMPAIQVAVSAGQLSTSLLQRKLSLGYARAARIVDTLEQMGIVSGFEGSKPRRVLITEEQYLEMKMKSES